MVQALQRSRVTIIPAQSNESIDTFLILLLFCSLQIGATFALEIKGIAVTYTDVALLVSLYIIAVKRMFVFSLHRYSKVLLLLICFNVIVELVSVIVIDKGSAENITLAVALIRNAALVFLIMNLHFDDRVLRWIAISGAIFSLIAIWGYFKSALNFGNIVMDSTLWDPGVFYSLDSGVLRLQGLREDPNFFFIVNLIPLCFVISLIRQRVTLINLLMLLVIVSASLLTFSRTGILLLGMVLLFFVLRRFHIKKLFWIAAILVILFVFPWHISASKDVSIFTDIFVTRFEKGLETGGSGRLDLWSVAWAGFEDSMLFGQGGRYTLRMAGNYTHNDYLEMLAAHGIIGFAGMTILYLYVLCYIRAQYRLFRRNQLFLSSSLLFGLMIIASLFFTIYYNPYIWFVVSLIYSPGSTGRKC